ncbi:SprT family zinc-dependent metalloprotease [Runella sp.]|jgi:hypothetical protein|uniref:M48 family metallopeptidase n=1 Tax=Runella sp. TaxID=1960881 RepID=UPI00260DEE5B|nr:SprT family zinc-dependent metalloprotease [Runella sp.]
MSEELMSVAFGLQTIAYELRRTARKSVRIQVHPNATVRVIAPLELTEDEVAKAVKQKAAWILKQLRFFEQFRPLTPPRQFRSGETHRYLGRQYRLKLMKGEKSIRMMAGFIEISLPDPIPETVAAVLDGWYRQRAEIYFQRILTEVMPRFESYGWTVPEIKLRKMPTRWGSCTSAGVIYLNPDLIKASGSSIEYVIIHELCHLAHRLHNQKFYELLGRILPDWQRRKQNLERMMV